MAEQVNTQNSTMHQHKKELSFIENIEIQLKAGDTIENLEITTQEHISDAEKELQILKEANASGSVVLLAKIKLEKWKSYNKAIASYKKTIEIEKELDQIADKIKKCYAETISIGETIVDFINQFDMANLGDIPKKKRNLDEKIISFERNLQAQLDLNKKSIGLLNELRDLKPNYDIYEQYRNLIPNYMGKNYEYVKEEYKKIVLKIKELEDKKEKSVFLNDRKKYEDLIKSLEETTKDVLPYLLSDPKKFEIIKKEVAEELGNEYQPPVTENDNEEQKGDMDTPKSDEETPKTGDNDETPTPTDDKKDEEPAKIEEESNVTAVSDEKFIAAKLEYINLIESINKLIDKIDDININQTQYAFYPESNYDRMITAEEEVIKINSQISRYKEILSEFEYKKYVDDHIMLNLDPEIKNKKVKEFSYNSDLEEFVNLHNNVIINCYKRLHEIVGIPDYKNNQELVAESQKLLDVIDVQHMVINRRLITERHKNKYFDIISFMQTHRVDPKKIKPQEQQLVPQTKENEETKNSKQNQIKELEKNISEFKNNLLTLYIARHLLKFKMAPVEQIEKETENINNNIAKLENDIRKQIEESELTEEQKIQFHKKIDEVKMQTFNEIENRFKERANVNGLREEFVNDIKILLEYSKELIKLSEVSVDSEEYKNEIQKYYKKIDEMKIKYEKYGVKFSVDYLTSKLKVTINEKSGLNIANINNSKDKTPEIINISVMTKEKEKKIGTQKNIKIKGNQLNFQGKIQNVNRRNSIIGTMNKVNITLLKGRIKIQYTKEMLEELKDLKVKLEVAASAENKNSIQVTKAVDTKDGKSEYRYINEPTKLTEAKIIYRDTETNEEIISYDILNDSTIQETLEERRKMMR